MHKYMPLVRILNGIEKDDQGTILEIDKEELVTHKCTVIGITGPPGAGKSTLLADMLKNYLANGEKIAVLLIDPSDSITGGAFLGDRIRFNNLPLHPNLFIRSVASRGFLGGVSLYTPLYIKAFIKWGFDKIFIETVGSGQNEVDIYTIADTSLYITSPDIGDSIQVLKGGSMNNFDIIVINKSDIHGANRTEALLRRNTNLFGNRGTLRIVKHQKGRDSSLTEIFEHIEATLNSTDKINKRKKLAKYYQINILKEQIERFLQKELQPVESDGSNTIINTMNLIKEKFKGGEIFAKGD